MTKRLGADGWSAIWMKPIWGALFIESLVALNKKLFRMKSGGSTQVKQPAYQLTVANKHDGRTTGLSDHILVRKQKHITLMPFNANDNIHNHGVLSASVLIRYKIMTSDRKKVIILTLSCLLTKMASPGHMSRVKPYSRGTGASKKGEMDPPRTRYWYIGIEGPVHCTGLHS